VLLSKRDGLEKAFHHIEQALKKQKTSNGTQSEDVQERMRLESLLNEAKAHNLLPKQKPIPMMSRSIMPAHGQRVSHNSVRPMLSPSQRHISQDAVRPMLSPTDEHIPQNSMRPMLSPTEEHYPMRPALSPHDRHASQESSRPSLSTHGRHMSHDSAPKVPSRIVAAENDGYAVDDAENPLQLLARASDLSVPSKHAGGPLATAAFPARIEFAKDHALQSFFGPFRSSFDVGEDIDPIDMGLVTIDECDHLFD
jgi:hypothetical protein